jgi:hypothetical protein
MLEDILQDPKRVETLQHLDKHDFAQVCCCGLRLLVFKWHS